MTGGNVINSGNYDYSISQDSSKVLIYYNLLYRKGKSEQFGFIVLDKGFRKLWSRQITLPYKDELFDINDYIIDNAGNFLLSRS